MSGPRQETCGFPRKKKRQRRSRALLMPTRGPVAMRREGIAPGDKGLTIIVKSFAPEPVAVD